MRGPNMNSEARPKEMPPEAWDVLAKWTEASREGLKDVSDCLKDMDREVNKIPVIAEKVDMVLEILQGKDLKGGMVVEVAVQGSSIRKQWYFISAIIVSILGLAAYVIRSGLVS